MDIFNGTVRDTATGAAQPGVQCTIAQADGITLATIYEADGITAKSNPFNADSQGRAIFSAPDGKYFIIVPTTTGPSSTPLVLKGGNSGGAESKINFIPANYGPYNLPYPPLPNTESIHNGGIINLDSSFYAVNTAVNPATITFQNTVDLVSYGFFTYKARRAS
jgi:hypothetical protein